MYNSVRGLSCALLAKDAIDVSVYGLRDVYTDEDIGAWQSVNVRDFTTIGPRPVGYAPDLKRELSSSAPDVIHQHGIWRYPSIAVQQYFNDSGRPFVVSPRGMLDPWALDNAKWKKRIAGWLFENEHLQTASCIHALNSSEAQSIRRYGLKNPVCILPNAVPLPGETTESKAPWASQGVPENKNTLLFLGRIHPKKGLIEFLKGWSALRTRGLQDLSKWQVVIVGWSELGHREELVTEVNKLGITADIHFVGSYYDAEKDAAFRHADAFVLPSHSEGLPMAVLEAWSYRLPVVMTPQCNISAGFEADAALHIEPEPSSIADGLRQLATMDADERKAMGERGRALVEQRFTWPHVAEQMHHVYRWMLGEADRPDCVITDTNQFALS